MKPWSGYFMNIRSNTKFWFKFNRKRLCSILFKTLTGFFDFICEWTFAVFFHVQTPVEFWPQWLCFYSDGIDRLQMWRLSVPQLFACTSDVCMFWISKMDMGSIILFKSFELLYLCSNHNVYYWDQLLSYILISIQNYFSCYSKKWFSVPMR